jgi:hypothetical protein
MMFYYISPYAAGKTSVDTKALSGLASINGFYPITVLPSTVTPSQLRTLIEGFIASDDVFQTAFLQGKLAALIIHIREFPHPLAISNLNIDCNLAMLPRTNTIKSYLHRISHPSQAAPRPKEPRSMFPSWTPHFPPAPTSSRPPPAPSSHLTSSILILLAPSPNP